MALIANCESVVTEIASACDFLPVEIAYSWILDILIPIQVAAEYLSVLSNFNRD